MPLDTGNYWDQARVQQFFRDLGFQRGSIYRGSVIQNLLNIYEDQRFRQFVNLFDPNHDYYGIEVLVTMILGHLPDRNQEETWWETGQGDDPHTQYTVFAPANVINRIREETLRTYPPEVNGTELIPYGDEILTVYHANFDIRYADRK